MRKSLLVSTLGAIAISIAALAAPAFAQDASAVQPHVQACETSFQTPSAMARPAAFQVPATATPTAVHATSAHQQADHRVVTTLKTNGTKVREFTRNSAKSWNNHQLQQRHPHTMQG